VDDYCVPTDESLKGAWRTPSLRDVAITAPYMHDGYYQTLEDVVWHYNVGGTASGTDLFANPDAGAEADAGTPAPNCPRAAPRGRAVQIKPLGLTNEEMNDLVEFLRTLTSTSVAPPPGFDAGAAPDVSGAPVCFSDGGTQ
jgi:cytochrome c peroxidase